MRTTQFNIRSPKTVLLPLLFLFGLHTRANIPDSLRDNYEHFLSVLRSNELNNKEAVDSVWDRMPWNWTEVEQVKFDEAINIIDHRLENTSNLEGKVMMHHLSQEIYKNRQLLGKAVVQYEKMIALHKVMNDSLGVVRDYHWLAWMYHRNKLYEESLISHDQALRLLEKLEMTEELAEMVWAHGYMYSVAGWELNNSTYQDSAVKYLGQSFDYCMALRGEVHLEWIITYAMALARQGKKRKAIEIANYGLEVAGRHNEILYKARFNKQLSQYYMALNMEDSAYYHIYESAVWDDQLHPPDDPSAIKLEGKPGRLHMHNLGFLIDIHSHFSHHDKAVRMLDRILYGKEKIPEKNTQMYYRKMAASIYYEESEFQKAAFNYLLYVNYADSLHRADLNKAREVKTAQMESQIMLEQERAQAEKEKNDEISRQEKKQLRFIIYSAAGLTFVIAIFLLIVYRRFKITNKQKKLIEKQKGLVETAYSQLDEKNKEILDSINYAKRIQSAILPNKSTVRKYLPDAFILYIPKAIVAGDFYWLETRENKILFAAADCTGHGVPGAMVSVVCVNGLNRSVREYGITNPGKILDKTREIVMQEFEKSDEDVNDGMDIALVSLTVAKSEGNVSIKPDTPISSEATATKSVSIEFAGAHNPLWVIRKGTEKVEEYKADRQPIGKFFHQEPYTTHTLEVNPGDMLYIFTDGFADQFGGERGKKYYAANFMNFLLKIKDFSTQEQKQKIEEEFHRWKGDHEQIDDICVIGIRV